MNVRSLGADFDAQSIPLNEVMRRRKRSVELVGFDVFLSEATPEELRNVIQHFVEVVEIRPNDVVGKMGKYTLGFLPGPDTPDGSEKAENRGKP